MQKIVTLLIKDPDGNVPAVKNHYFEETNWTAIEPTSRTLISRFFHVQKLTGEKDPGILISLKNETFNAENISFFQIRFFVADTCEIQNCRQTAEFDLKIEVQNRDEQPAAFLVETNSTCRIEVTDEDTSEPEFYDLQNVIFFL